MQRFDGNYQRIDRGWNEILSEVSSRIQSLSICCKTRSWHHEVTLIYSLLLSMTLTLRRDSSYGALTPIHSRKQLVTSLQQTQQTQGPTKRDYPTQTTHPHYTPPPASCMLSPIPAIEQAESAATPEGSSLPLQQVSDRQLSISRNERVARHRL